MKKRTEKTDLFTASQVGTLIEELRSDFHTLADNQTSMDEKFSGKFDLLFEEFGRQKEDIHVIKTDIRFMKTDISVLKSDVAILKSDVTVLKTDVAEIKDIIGGNDKRLVKLEESCLK